MNRPAFIVVKEFEKVIVDMRISLSQWLIDNNFVTINYDYGSIINLNQRLLKKDEAGLSVQKFPLVFLRQPFTLTHDSWGKFATTSELDIFIIHETNKDWTEAERMEKVFEPVLYILYAELITQLNKPGRSLRTFQNARHTQEDFYYWGEAQQQVLNDIVDCMKVGNINLQVNNNSNCDPEQIQ